MGLLLIVYQFMFDHNLLLGLTPYDIKAFLQPIIDEEGSLEGNFDDRPKLTVSDSFL